jgi:FkbM family methyltransferase
MNNRTTLLTSLDYIEKLAKGTRWQRLFNNPVRYTTGIWWKEIQYPRLKLGKEVITDTFFQIPMKVMLPAGLDLFLLGAKGHDSEIRLAKWLIDQLQEGDTFIDVGAHFGYYTLLAQTLVGDTGKVIAFEAAPKTFSLLAQNVKPFSNVVAVQKAIADKFESVNMYEFPVLYSEYSTLDTKPFENMEWFEANRPEVVKTQAISLDYYCQQEAINPSIIKIDVEGGEGKVLKGLQHRLRFSSPKLVMEFARKNFKEHLEALKWLSDFKYQPFYIQQDGKLAIVHSVSAYFESIPLESDNFVLQRM